MSDAEAREWIDTATPEEVKFAVLQEKHWTEEAEAQRAEAEAEQERLQRRIASLRRSPLRCLIDALRSR